MSQTLRYEPVNNLDIIVKILLIDFHHKIQYGIMA